MRLHVEKFTFFYMERYLKHTISKNHSDWLDSEIDNSWGCFLFWIWQIVFDFWSSLGFWKSAILFTVESLYKKIRCEYLCKYKNQWWLKRFGQRFWVSKTFFLSLRNLQWKVKQIIELFDRSISFIMSVIYSYKVFRKLIAGLRFTYKGFFVVAITSFSNDINNHLND